MRGILRVELALGAHNGVWFQIHAMAGERETLLLHDLAAPVRPVPGCFLWSSISFDVYIKKLGRSLPVICRSSRANLSTISLTTLVYYNIHT